MRERQEEIRKELLSQFESLYQGMKEKILSMQESIDSKLELDQGEVDKENDGSELGMFSTPRKMTRRSSL